MRVRVRSRIGSVFALIFIAVVFVVMFGISASTNYSRYLDERGQLDAIESGVTVEAKIVDYYYADEDSNLVWLEYEYRDGSRIYRRSWKIVYLSEVDKYIGQKIEVYIDGNGHSIAVDQTPPDAQSSLRTFIIYVVICVVVIVVDAVLIAVLIRKRKKAQRKKSDTTENAKQWRETDTDENTAESEELDTEESVRALIEKIERKNAAELAYGNASGKARKYTLTVSDQINPDKIENPKPEDLEHALSVLKTAHDHYIILESDTPVDKFTFIQATDFEDGKCYVEAQYKVGRVLRSFGNSGVTEAELLGILQDFLAGKAPDISDWKHVKDYRP